MSEETIAYRKIKRDSFEKENCLFKQRKQLKGRTRAVHVGNRKQEQDGMSHDSGMRRTAVSTE